MVKALCVDPARIKEVWPHASDFVKRALEPGYSDFAEIEKKIFDGLLLLWLATDGQQIKGVAVTGLVGDACEIIGLSGHDLKEWFHLRTEIEDYALTEGCERMRIIGRKGWKRMLPDYEQTLIVMEKIL